MLPINVQLQSQHQNLFTSFIKCSSIYKQNGIILTQNLILLRVQEFPRMHIFQVQFHDFRQKSSILLCWCFKKDRMNFSHIFFISRVLCPFEKHKAWTLSLLKIFNKFVWINVTCCRKHRKVLPRFMYPSIIALIVMYNNPFNVWKKLMLFGFYHMWLFIYKVIGSFQE